MAKKAWNNPIDKNVDWGGDATTGNLPVSGEMVQRFIKESLNGKAGLFHYDATNNRYLVFADADARDEYLLDPTQTKLIIGTFDAPFNYTAEINLTSAAYNAVFLGSTGNYIDFTFDIKNKQGDSTGENVTITYTFIRNAVRQTVTETRKFGDAVHFNIDKYIGEGTNTIIIGVSGQTTLAATTVAVTYQVVNLSFTDEFDISKAYDLSSGYAEIEVPFTLSGFGTKVVEWYIDGEQLAFVKNEDEVVDTSTERTKYISIENLQHGRHSLQIRAYTTINGDRFYTDTLYRDFFVDTGVDTTPMVGVAVSIPTIYGVTPAGESPTLYGLVQYVPYTLRFATYSPTGQANVDVEIRLGDEKKGSVTSKNGVENTFTFVSMSVGSKPVVLTTLGSEYTLGAYIDATSMDLHEIQTGLQFDFSASGRSNNTDGKDQWSFGDYIGTLTGFNWNNTSGWVNNRLKMNPGASFAVNYSPLSGSPTSTGMTIELEFKTLNVKNDNAVVCDLRGSSGAGLLITATKVSLISKSGVVIETEYKSGEDVRVSFVINRSSGAANKCLSFIYTNGCVARGEKWASNDSYESDREILFSATEEVEVELKALRVYSRALSSDEILNNFILYRDTLTEMMSVYDRNDVYADGVFSPEKLMTRLPVMIVTGDIPTLENTSDKDTQIIVDIEYYNMQDPTRSFKMVGAAMRPQGTSSMGYPKKNFRIYTQKVSGTILYDAENKVVADKLYAFKQNSQPVNCWCLKADYAESSGTHNTGIARLWNEALMNAQIDGEYKLRTEAQKKALETGYPYDVRTAIDGFPILLFYRPTANDSLIFIGKYNFNNDKSTESVFGFKGIPNFDNSKMQCWEVLNNGNALALFTTVEGFDEGWSEAFESRYPDTKTPDTTYLKRFCEWIVGVKDDPARFKIEKWEHLDVYKIAAYWSYIMRHAGADQLVKNAMFTSEDGLIWYYILYDNDTINGLINTGHLEIEPTADRQTKNASDEYVFAGHDSVLWNLLEADEEFMSIVSTVDNALYSAGISYSNTIRVFDTEQADKWAERIYNQDSQYKYIGPYVDKGVNNLFMLQGKRDLHRRWWLAKRFSIYDAKFVSGTYKSQAIELKCLNDTPAGQKFSITAGYPLDYGYGINNVPREFGVTLNVNESYEFTTEEVVNRGDPIRIYGAPNISEVNLSPMVNVLALINVASVYDEALGTRLKRLIVGSPNVINTEVSEISGLKQASSLEELDIQGMTKILSLDLSSHPYLKTLKAWGSGVTSVLFTKGAPVERLELSSAMQIIHLEQLPYLTAANILSEGISGVTSIEVSACPNVSNDFGFVYNWYSNKTADDKDCSLIMDTIDWKDIDVEQLIELTQLGTLSLKGVVKANDITLEQVESLMDIFGEGVFDKNSEFFIDAPPVSFVTGRNEILEGDSEQYSVIVFGAEVKKVSWAVVSGGNSYYTSLSQSGLLQVTEGYGNGTIVVRTTIITDKGTSAVDTSVVVKKRVYPTQSQTSIVGDSSLSSELNLFELEYSTSGITGATSAVWTLEGVEGYAEIESFTDTTCVVKKIQEAISVVSGTLKCSLTKKNTGVSLFSVTKELKVVNENIAETDPGICASLYSAGLCANETFITKDEARLITAEQLQPGTSFSTSIFYKKRGSIKSFNGFEYFTGLTYVPRSLFYENYNLQEINLPNTITEIRDGAFEECRALQRIYIPSSVTSAGYNAFYVYSSRTHSLKYVDIDDLQSWYSIEFYTGDSSPFALAPNNGVSAYLRINGVPIKEVHIPGGITIKSYAFANQGVERISFEASTIFEYYALSYMHALKELIIPEGLQEIRSSLCVSDTALESIDIPESVHTINEGAFWNCSNLKSITGGEAVSSIPLTSSGVDPFSGISKEVTIAPECTFSLVWCSENGYYISIRGAGYKSSKTMSSMINTVLNGNCEFTVANNNYFEGGSTYKTLTISHTGKLEDVADRVKIHSHNLILTTNRSDAQFEISYTDVDSGEASSMIVTGGGTYQIPAKGGTTLIVSPVTQYEGYMATAVTITATINSNPWTATINYVEKTDIYIQHIDGTLHSVDDWMSAGYANSQANGVAVTSGSTSFVIAKNMFEAAWGGYAVDISSAITPKSTIAAAVLDFDGKGNTTKVIEALSGQSDHDGVVGAPAAEACANYTFPNGKIGYLGSAGQWQRIVDNLSTIKDALACIGVNHYLSSTSMRFWTSTPRDNKYTVWAYRGGRTALEDYNRSFTDYNAIPFTDIE